MYARPDLPTPLNRTNIRAGNCIVHTIDRVSGAEPSVAPLLPLLHSIFGYYQQSGEGSILSNGGNSTAKQSTAQCITV